MVARELPEIDIIFGPTECYWEQNNFETGERNYACATLLKIPFPKFFCLSGGNGNFDCRTTTHRRTELWLVTNQQKLTELRRRVLHMHRTALTHGITSPKGKVAKVQGDYIAD